MRTKKHCFELMLLGAAILFLVACNLSSLLPQTPNSPPVVTQMEQPTLASTLPSAIIPAWTFTPLPPMPDFEEILTFGGGGAGQLGCDHGYPPTPNSISVSTTFGRHAILCVFLQNVNTAAPIQLNLTQYGGTGMVLRSNNLILDRGWHRAHWDGFEAEGNIETWTRDSLIKFVLSVWWPVTLPAGDWRFTVSQVGGLQVSGDFRVSKQVDRSYINALDARSEQELTPDNPFVAVQPLQLSDNGRVTVAGTDFPPDVPVYILLYHEKDKFISEYDLIEKKIMISSHSGSIAGELSGPFGAGQTYILYGVTNPNAVLGGEDFVTCDQALGQTAGSACDYFSILPDSSALNVHYATHVPSSCPGAPPQWMIVSQRGYVCTRSESVRLRVSPSRSASTLIQLEPGTQFTVIGDPSCSDNWSWWNVQLDNGTLGWLAEGGDKTDPYFICPLP